jgi:hypothetical protein
MMYKTAIDSDIQTAYDNYIEAVRSGNQDEIDDTKMVFDMLIDQKNHQINQNKPK